MDVDSALNDIAACARCASWVAAHADNKTIDAFVKDLRDVLVAARCRMGRVEVVARIESIYMSRREDDDARLAARNRARRFIVAIDAFLNTLESLDRPA